jgi:outer membrane autotransporter protein
MAAFDGGDGSDTALVTVAEYDGSQILDGGDDLFVADGWIDTLTLQGLDLNVPGANIIDWENVVVDGGTIVFSDGMIAVGSDAGTGLTLQNGAVLDATTAPLSILGNLANNAVVDMQDGATGDSIFVSGNYSGTGALLVDTDFAADLSDTLIVGGDVIGGTTVVGVNDVTTGTSTGNDVLVVDVAGTSSAGDFSSPTIAAGAYLYDLNQVGSDWYLQATSFVPTAETFAPALTVIQGMGRDYLGNLWERMGHRETGWSASGRTTSGRTTEGSGVWGRAHGKLLHADEEVTSTDATFETAHGFLQAGVDFAGFDFDDGDVVLSLMGHYGTSATDVDNAIRKKISDIDIDGYGIGGSVTFYNAAQTFFADAVGQATWYDVDIHSTQFGSRGSERTARAKTDGFGYALSFEAGYRHAISDQWAFVPQAQLIYSNSDFDNVTDSEGVALSVLDGESLEGRIGVALEGHSDVSFGYFRLNLIEEFMGKNKILASSTTFETDVSGASFEMSAGGSFLVSPGVRLYTDSTGRTGLEKELHSFRGTVGAKVNW